MAGADPQTHELAFTVGSRRLARARRKLVPLAFSLEDALAGRLPALPDAGRVDGVRVLSAPAGMIAAIRARFPGFLPGAEQRYRRAYIAMEGGFEEYMAGFSARTRATLRRKQRKLEEASGGALDLREYRTPAEIAAFFAAALPLSERTYQARLLDAGLPKDVTARDEAAALAARDRVRGFILFLAGEAIAYLYLPVEGETLVYAYLGHDPAHAALSPGTVLQLAALERLFGEKRFRYFDFTEGDGQHKTLFGTGGVACASFVLLRPTLANRALLAALAGFDGAVAAGKALARRSGAEGALRRMLRR